MYPIQRDDYINAHIAAISEEMRQSRHSRKHTAEPAEPVNRFHKTIARILHREGRGTAQMRDPVPHG